jgi:hypothetical protein
MNQILSQPISKDASDIKTNAYCKRNNINEYQFKKALAWYHSAIQSSKKEKSKH